MSSVVVLAVGRPHAAEHSGELAGVWVISDPSLTCSAFDVLGWPRGTGQGRHSNGGGGEARVIPVALLLALDVD